MNWTRITSRSALIACGLSLFFVTGKPVLAKSRPLFETLFVVRADWPQVPEKKDDPKDEIPLPDGEGKAITKKTCGNCHSTNVWAKQRHTTVKWGQIIDNMVSKGLEASDDDLATINDYLGKYFAPPLKDATTPPPTAPSSR